jgi:hypothetical protein
MAERMPQEVLLNDGEGIHHGDINLLQRYMHSFFLDGYLAQLGRVAVSDLGALTTHCYAVGFSGAPYGHASTNRTSRNLGGLILQRLGSSQPSGDDPQFLAYYIDADEAGFLHDTAAANPRWDIITVKLEQTDSDTADNATRDYEDAATGAITSETFVKKRKVKATITVTKGTEAASPTEPATPAGHVKLAAFRVTVGMTTFNAKTDIRDYRMPLGFAEEWIPGRDTSHASAQWTTDTATGALTNVAGGAHQAISWPRANMSRARRVIGLGLGISTLSSTTHTMDLGRVDPWTGFTSVESLTLNVGNGYRAQGWSTFEPALPLWTNGYAAGYAVTYESGGTAPILGQTLPCPEVSAFKVVSDTTNTFYIAGIRWFLAG